LSRSELISDDSRRAHREAVVVDCHNDLVLSLAATGIGARATFKHRWLPALRAGGVDVQVCPLYSFPEIPEAALHVVLRQIAAIKREVHANASELALCRSGDEIDAAVASGKIALVIAMEGALPLGSDATLLEVFYELGVRMISFTHNWRTLVADGSAENAAGSRLPTTGVTLLREMERLGIVFDASHLAAASLEHVLELATRPIVASHSAARALCDHHRNLSDDQIRAIAQTGGVIGVNLLAKFIDPDEPTIERAVDHFVHIIEVAGVEHVGLGADFLSELRNDIFPASFELGDADVDIPNLHEVHHLPNLTHALLARGLDEAEVRLILGENLLRVFREDMPPQANAVTSPN
jgi:membrane dipeptidase